MNCISIGVGGLMVVVSHTFAAGVLQVRHSASRLMTGWSGTLQRGTAR